jgi:hypothetical protein
MRLRKSTGCARIEHGPVTKAPFSGIRWLHTVLFPGIFQFRGTGFRVQRFLIAYFHDPSRNLRLRTKAATLRPPRKP